MIISKLIGTSGQRYDKQNRPVVEEVKNHVLVDKINEIIKAVNINTERVEGIMNVNENISHEVIQKETSDDISKEIRRLDNKIRELNNKIQSLRKES